MMVWWSDPNVRWCSFVLHCYITMRNATRVPRPSKTENPKATQETGSQRVALITKQNVKSPLKVWNRTTSMVAIATCLRGLRIQAPHYIITVGFTHLELSFFHAFIRWIKYRRSNSTGGAVGLQLYELMNWCWFEVMALCGHLTTRWEWS